MSHCFRPDGVPFDEETTQPLTEDQVVMLDGLAEAVRDLADDLYATYTKDDEKAA
jgi:hypothetical protein